LALQVTRSPLRASAAMSVSRRTIIAGLAGAIAIAGTRLRAQAQPAPVVRVAFIAVDDEAEALYASDAGFFTKAGLNVELNPMPNAGAVASAVAAGGVDIGFVPVIPVAVAHHKNIPLVVIAPGSVFSSQGPISSLFIAPNAPYRKAADLNGKTIAVPGLASIAEYGARTWLDKNGADLTTIKFLEVPFPLMAAGLIAGRVDAAMITEPFLTAAKPVVRVMVPTPFAAIAPEFAFGVWVTSASWAKEHLDTVARFSTAIQQTAAWANKNHRASAEILQKYTKIDAATVAAMSRSEYTDRLSPALLQPVIDIAAKYASFAPFPASELLFTPTR
jgi:NitT/TauT family transport system substrate-binding protein